MTHSGLFSLRRLHVFVCLLATPLLFFIGVTGPALAASGCGLTARPGLQEISFESDGLQRRVVVFVPPGYSAKTKLPVVFDLHGSNSFPRAQLTQSAWPDVAAENGFIVAAPEGGLNGKLPNTHAWNVPGVTPGGGPDDAEFLNEAIDQVKARFCVDDTRLFASGYSGGGRMLSQYICNGNRDFSAAGFVMSLRAGYPMQQQGKWMPDSKTCHPAQPVSIIAFWGAKDNTNPYAGGGKPYWQYGGQMALNRWAELDGCAGPEKVSKGVKISSAQFDRCKGGAQILSYTIADQTHDWPAKTISFSPVGTATEKTKVSDADGLYAAKRMWAFFANSNGRLIADGVAKTTCASSDKSGSPSSSMVDPACPAALKATVKPKVVDGPMAADAL
ncbi:polyhydroxybutyrate depolymerase [Rhizobium sp.]|jgi:polyhydroxybutyrate depolymerase|uniref:alpha/beta hydrolase family esterase n=1 Tax=Rhizobium sp. TaxID=391 RepID=UPI000E8467FC|nr:polyhydroxybutyrate depolymerase [Rhizobium sp.]